MASSPAPGDASHATIKLPGFNRPLNWLPSDEDSNQYTRWCLFSTALASESGGTVLPLTTLRELTMLQIMNSITDKDGWGEKVFDGKIAEKWKSEAIAMKGSDVTQKMMSWVIDELRYKARGFKQTGAIGVYNGDVVKSDTAVPEAVRKTLQDAVKVLEDIPKVYKDYHPGSQDQVLDLVHPSLFPLVYGKSRILEDKCIGLHDCVQNTGNGVVVPIRPDEEQSLLSHPLAGHRHMYTEKPYSKHYQWLPCEVDVSGGDGAVKVTSYINNLHPQNHPKLYSVIEKVIAASIPLWNTTLTPLRWGYYDTRIKVEVVQFNHDWEVFEGPSQDEDEDDDAYDLKVENWTGPPGGIHTILPEPGVFQPPTEGVKNSQEFGKISSDTSKGDDDTDSEKEGDQEAVKTLPDVDLRAENRNKNLQIIVKLANIELTPENPTYGGGTWHVEGQLNEHICATSLYYYDNQNITDSYLAFRQQSSHDEYPYHPQNVHDWLTDIYGCRDGESTVQEVGSVLCKEGRLLTFPNILQHKVQPFGLADPTRNGHRKILALFLVDPGIRIISTANVPPQQRDWWAEKVGRDLGMMGDSSLSTEIKDQIFDRVDFPIGMDEAKEIRLKLMEERSHSAISQGKEFEERYMFSLCEH